MRLKTEFRTNDQGADIYLALPVKDPSWMLLRFTERDTRLSGYFAGPSADGIPSVRPVVFENRMITPQTVGTIAVWSFMSANNLHGAVPGQTAKVSAADQLTEWENFLNGGKKSDVKTNDQRLEDDPDTVMLTKEQFLWLKDNTLIRDLRGALIPRHRMDFVLGSSVSGFDALKIRNGVSKVFKSVPFGNPENIELAKEALGSLLRPSSNAVHWYASAQGQAATDRMQAAKSYPLLAGIIADNPMLSRAVDDREPLQPIIIEQTALSKGALKRVGGLTRALPVGKLFEAGQWGEDAMGINRERRFPVSGELSLDKALKILSELPPDRVPQDDRSWMIFHDIVAGCAIPLENSLGIPVVQTLSSCKGDWVQFHATLARAADFDPDKFDRRAIALTTIDALEAIEDFSRTAIIPLALSSIEATGEHVPEVSNEFFTWGNRTATKICTGNSKNLIASLFEMARRFASRITAIHVATGYTVEDDGKGAKIHGNLGPESIPLLTKTFVASNGRVIRPFNEKAGMREETKRLGHCIGGEYHTSNARRAGGHYFSCQNLEGTISYSSIQIDGIKGEDAAQAVRGINLVQHYAKGNTTPDAASKKAYDEWMAALQSGELAIDFDLIREWRAAGFDETKIRQAAVTWKGVIGMEWQQQENRQACWEEWRYIMGGPYGKSPSPDVIFREQGARDLVAAMSPKAAAIMIERQKAAKEAAAAAKPEEETVPVGP